MKIKTVPFDPDVFVPKYSPKKIVLLEKYQDRNSLTLLEVDFERVDFLTCLQGHETLITGEEKLQRLKKTELTLCGATVFMGLWQDYNARGQDSVLELLYTQKNINSIDFFGDVIETPGGEFCLWLYRFPCDNKWHWLYGWLFCECIFDRKTAVLAKGTP